MKITLEVDFEDAMKTNIDPPQRDWSEQDFINTFLEELNECVQQSVTGVRVDIKDEEGKTLIQH